MFFCNKFSVVGWGLGLGFFIFSLFLSSFSNSSNIFESIKYSLSFISNFSLCKDVDLLIISFILLFKEICSVTDFLCVSSFFLFDSLFNISF